MTPETFMVEFWRSGCKDRLPRLLLNRVFEYDEAAQVCASLQDQGYLVLVYKLVETETPAVGVEREK